MAFWLPCFKSLTGLLLWAPLESWQPPSLETRLSEHTPSDTLL